MSRIKILLLVLLVLIIAALGIVFIQNQQPITLKLLCADSSQPCLYQTPPLPLAAWIALATLAGAIANLLIQSLSRYGYSRSRRQKSVLDDDLYPQEQNWTDRNGRRGSYAETVEFKESLQDTIPEAKSYETRQEPQNIERSGSTYSYKYREADDRAKYKRDSKQQNPSESKAGIDLTKESDDEDWI